MDGQTICRSDVLLEGMEGHCTARWVCCQVAQRLMCYGVLPGCRVKVGRLCSSRYYAVQKSFVLPVGSLLICVER